MLETHSSLASDLGRDRHLGFDAVSAVRGSRLEPAFEGVTVPRRAIPPCRLEPSGDAVIDARVGLYVSLVPLLTLSLAQVEWRSTSWCDGRLLERPAGAERGIDGGASAAKRKAE